MSKQLDPYTLRAVARWHRKQFRLSPYPSAWEAHLVSAKHWQERARSLTKQPRKLTPATTLCGPVPTKTRKKAKAR